MGHPTPGEFFILNFLWIMFFLIKIVVREWLAIAWLWQKDIL
jgi:hypothetical protein